MPSETVMHDEVTTPFAVSTGELSQPGFSTVSVNSASWLRALIWIAVGVEIIAIAAYAILAAQTGAWQFMAGIGVFLISLLLILFARRYIRQNRYNAAGYSIILGFAV